MGSPRTLKRRRQRKARYYLNSRWHGPAPRPNPLSMWDELFKDSYKLFLAEIYSKDSILFERLKQ